MRRHMAWLLLVVSGTVAGIWGFGWWTERPLEAVRASLESDRPRQALREVNRFLARHRQSDTGLLLKARVLTELGRMRQAERIFETVGATEPADLHAWGRCLASRGQWSAALLPLEQLISSPPHHAKALYEASVCWSRLGRHDRALVHARNLAQVEHYQARGWFLVGSLHNNSDNKLKAVEAWDHVKRIPRGLASLQMTADKFHLAYARAALELGRGRLARQAIDQSLALKRTADALIISGETPFRAGQLQLARKNWTEAVSHPEIQADALRLARLSLARIELQQQHPTQALQWLEPLDDQHAPSRTAYLFQRAHTMLDHTDAANHWKTRTIALRKQEDRDSTIERALTESPRAYWSRVVQAYRFAQQGNPEQALVMIKQLPESDNDFARDLAKAIRHHTTLPTLERLPIEHF